MPAAAAAAIAASPIAKGLVELAQRPVLGWQRTVRQVKGKKHPKEIVTQHSFSLRVWELGALGVAALGTLAAYEFFKPKYFQFGGEPTGVAVPPVIKLIEWIPGFGWLRLLWK